jgi:hypothetical protein
MPPTCCPDGHSYADPGWSVTSVWCTCNGQHMAWRCWCGRSLYAPQPGPHCHKRTVKSAQRNLQELEDPKGKRLKAVGGVTLYERWINTPKAAAH